MEDLRVKFAEKLVDLLNDPGVIERLGIEPDAGRIQNEPNVLAVTIDGVDLFIEVTE